MNDLEFRLWTHTEMPHVKIAFFHMLGRKNLEIIFFALSFRKSYNKSHDHMIMHVQHMQQKPIPIVVGANCSITP